MSTKPVILCRTHADAKSGFGHLIRVVTLADALRENGLDVRLALSGDQSAFTWAQLHGYRPRRRKRFEPEEISLDDLPAAVVVDSYLYSRKYLAAWRQAGVKTIIIDDLADRSLRANLVINPNIIAEEFRFTYEQNGCRRLLLGLEYALIRPEIQAERNTPPAREPTVLVIFGATDVGGRTARVIQGLAEATQPFRLEAVIGPGAQTAVEVERAVEMGKARGRQVEMLTAPQDFAWQMARATLAVSAGGVTATELACLGRPAVLVPVAENQIMAAHQWQEKNVHRLVKDPSDMIGLRAQVGLLLDSPNVRQAMSAIGRQLVDGRGASRVAAQISQWLGREQ